jgi:outer membrane usher protein
VTGDRWGVDLTLSSQFASWMSGSLSVGYSNDGFLRDFKQPTRDDGEFRVGLRIFIRPTDDTRLSTTYDSLNQSTYASGHWSQRSGRERWEASADAYKTGLDDNAVASASVGYSGNRFEARAIHSSGVGTSGWTSGVLTPGDQRTSLRVGTSIAFADGAVAVGPPIRSNGFAIVAPHDSIADKAVTVGDKELPRAKSDGLGPAIVTDLPAYAPTNLPIDVAGLPTGYSLGEGGHTIVPPYRAGYRLEIGSAYSVSAYGTLLTADGSPVPLLSGTAIEQKDGGRKVALFTNAAGRFGAEGLAPGLWRIEIASDGETLAWTLDIPKGTDGLFKAGTLKPAGP